MTAAELIEQLEKFPPNLIVTVFYEGCCHAALENPVELDRFYPINNIPVDCVMLVLD